MKIAAAQVKPLKGNIPVNIATHKRMIDLAVDHKADAIFFPELSITGYEPQLASELAIDKNDKRFDDFQKISEENSIAIGFGMPVKANDGIQIGMIIFQPAKMMQVYAKQTLHEDENPYFVPGENELMLKINRKLLAPAICYESLQIEHAGNANKSGAEIYIASVAKSKTGVDKAMKHYSKIAKEFSMIVLMSNCVGSCDSFYSIGKSSVWNKQGNLVGQLDENSEGVLIFDTEKEQVILNFLE